MRKLGLVLLAIMLVVPMVMAGIPINDQVSIDGNMRWRSEITGKVNGVEDFNSDTGMNEFQTLRTMIGVKVQASDDVLFRVKFKESRYVGTQGSNKAASTEFQAQEAYMCMKNFLSPNLGLKVGRYEMWYGRKRILGTGGWNWNGPRTYDAITLMYGNDAMKWDISYARTSSSSTPAEQGPQDRHLFIIAGKMLGGNLQPLVFVDWDGKSYRMDDPTTTADDQTLTLTNDMTITPAVYYKHKMGGLQLDVDGAVQVGKRQMKDVMGWLIAADLAYTLDNPMKPKFGLGIDVTSGNGYDQDVDADALPSFPFMSRHLYRGFMDFFKDVNQGMIDGIFRFGIKPSKAYSLSLDIHNFMYLTDEYSVPGDINTKYTQIGQEVDLRYKRNLAKNLGLDCAYCIFMASEDYKGADADMAHFAYIALTAKF